MRHAPTMTHVPSVAHTKRGLLDYDQVRCRRTVSIPRNGAQPAQGSEASSYRGGQALCR